MSLDWGEIFGLSVSPWELVIRGSAMYLFLFLAFRVVVRRRIGAVGWNWLIDLLNFRFPALQGWLEAAPLPLIDHGRVLHRNLRREFVSIEELKSKLREHGVTDLAEVEKAFMEPDGDISVVRRRDFTPSTTATSHR